jgi:hypothetical protein
MNQSIFAKLLQRSSPRPPEDFEPLLPALEPYLNGTLLHHPLIIRSDVLNVERCVEINRLFRQKKAKARQVASR